VAAHEQTAETLVGAAVLGAVAMFLVYALSVAGSGAGGGGYEVTARFGQVGGLAPGADVRVAGVKVGTVADLELDPQTYLAVTRIALRSDVKLPADSTAKITSDGLLGGSHVAIAPGGAPENLKPGDQIENVQGAVDLFGLIGQVIRPPATPQAPPTDPIPAADPYPGE
jgi:phospholipid/cholesterol/gamma-HCH transport system substrate-binding protein